MLGWYLGLMDHRNTRDLVLVRIALHQLVLVWNHIRLLGLGVARAITNSAHRVLWVWWESGLDSRSALWVWSQLYWVWLEVLELLVGGVRVHM